LNAGQTQLEIFRRRANFVGTKFGGGGKRGRAKIPSPPTPFLFARPSVQFGARSAPSIPFKKSSDFVKQTHPGKRKTDKLLSVFLLESKLLCFRACVPGAGIFSSRFIEKKKPSRGREHLVECEL